MGRGGVLRNAMDHALRILGLTDNSPRSTCRMAATKSLIACVFST